MELSNILKAVNKTEGSYLQQLLSSPVNRLIQFSDVELTEDEIAEALVKAKSEKHTRLQYAHNEELRRKRNNLLMMPFNETQLIDYCKQFYWERNRFNFIIDDKNEALVKKMALYFTGNHEFETGGYSLKKGIMIMGNVGTGKTDLMKFFQKNKRRCFKIISCTDVANDFSLYGEYINEVFSTLIEKPLCDPDVFFQRHVGYCFDDLGTEDIKNNFGNKKNVMADVIMTVYAKKEYSSFHITTNLSSEEIEKMYGTRVRSRLREMFNVFELKGTDRRK